MNGIKTVGENKSQIHAHRGSREGGDNGPATFSKKLQNISECITSDVIPGYVRQVVCTNDQQL